MFPTMRLAAMGSVLALFAACTSSGAGGREVNITQRDDGCTPASVKVQPGEKLKLVVKNESKKDYEVEGIEGTKLEEIVVPEGRTRSPGYTVPGAASGTYKLKCYVPGGVSTVIELVAGGGGPAAGATPEADPDPEAEEEETEQSSSGPGDVTVAVTMTDYAMNADKASVKEGDIRFIATNASAGQKHEMEVLRVKGDGSFDAIGEVEAIAPGAGGALTLELEPGAYQLACLIAKGEDGSPVDHYAQGMHTDFTVES